MKREKMKRSVRKMKRKDREVTDQSEIRSILEKTQILHMGLMGEEYPYIVPLHYGYAYTEDQLIFFMHGAKEGYKLDLIRENPHVCVELECDIAPVSGGEVPCRYGSTFASVIGRGKAELVEDEKEKIYGLQRLMEHQTGRKFEIDSKMADSVAVIKVTVSEYTAKARK